MSRDRKKHYILSPEERQRLLALGAEINHEIKDALVIVTCQTYQRWVKEANAGKEPQRVGRKARHLVENAFLRLKKWRGIWLRYAKRARSYLAAVQIRCVFCWLKIL